MSASLLKSTFGRMAPWRWLRAAWESHSSPSHDAYSQETAPNIATRTICCAQQQIILRPFNFSQDANSVCAFQREIYTLNFDDFEYTTGFATSFRHNLQRAAHNEDHGLFVLEDHKSHRVGGFLWLVIYRNHWTGERYGYVNNVFVIAPWRGHGLGHELMRETEAFFRNRNVHLIRLSVTASNKTATHLYQSLGYEVARWEMEKKL